MAESLKETTILRCGVTAHRYNFETKQCTAEVNTAGKSLDLRFTIASKGGGETALLVRLGLPDMSTVLKNLANTIPETLPMLLEATSIASKRNIERIKTAKQAGKKLGKVQEFVYEKYAAAPYGQDQRESDLNAILSEVITTLSEP
jgi:hypothetical protein